MNRSVLAGLGILLLLSLLAWPAARSTAEDEDKSAAASEEVEPLVFELRTYTTHEGRLPALHKRFREHTLALFEKHGMTNVIYWTPEDKDNTLVYVVAHESREAADKSWAAFINDPDWKKAAAASEKDGPIVAKVERQYLTATEYSPMK